MGVIRRLQRTKKDQYILTIPKSVVELLGWKEQDSIEFGFEDGKITLKKLDEQQGRKAVKKASGKTKGDAR